MTRKEGAPPVDTEAFTMLGAAFAGVWAGVGLGAIKDQPYVNAQAELSDLQDYAGSLHQVLITAKKSSDPGATAAYSFLTNEIKSNDAKITVAKQDMPPALGSGEQLLMIGGSSLALTIAAVGILRAGYRVRSKVSRHRSQKNQQSETTATN